MAPIVPVKPVPIFRIVAFDLEWRIKKDKFGEHMILSASFVDSEGNKKTLLLEDFLYENGIKRTEFDAEKSLLGVILKVLSEYNWSIGFYTTGVRVYNPRKYKREGRDSDLIQLHTRLKRHGMEFDSPVWINDKNNRPYLTGKNRDHNHIDAYKLFTNKTIKASIYKNMYTNLSLDAISRAILGDQEGGKYNGLSGPIYESLNLSDKRNYVLSDSDLLLKCVAKDNYVLLRVINSLSNTTQVPFRDMCNSGGISKVITAVLDTIVLKEIDNAIKESYSSLSITDVTKEEVLSRAKRLYEFKVKKINYDNNITVIENDEIKQEESDDLDEEEEPVKPVSNKRQPRYIGGLVLDPTKGEYKDVSILDIASLYPSLIINHNLSFETVNCQHEECKNDPLAKVPEHILPDGKWHVCRKFKGILPQILEDYRNERLSYKRQSKADPEAALKSNAYKILINGAYGYLGFQFAKYGNLEAAELVTRYGRYTLTRCIEIAKKIGWDCFYGDTDSLFIRGSIKEEDKALFIETCQKELNVTMEYDKFCSKFIITGKKNYAGVQILPNESKKLIISGLSGIKSIQCAWVKTTFRQMLEDYKNDVNPCDKIREQLKNLENDQIPNKEFNLIKSKNLGRNPDEYVNNIVQKVLGLKNELQEGDTVRYYLADPKTIKWTEDISQISIKGYREQLLTVVNPILRLLGYNTRKEFAKMPPNVFSLMDISKRKKGTLKAKKDKIKIDAEKTDEDESNITPKEILSQSKQLMLADAINIERIVESSGGKSAEISIAKLSMIPKRKVKGNLVQI